MDTLVWTTAIGRCRRGWHGLTLDFEEGTVGLCLFGFFIEIDY